VNTSDLDALALRSGLRPLSLRSNPAVPVVALSIAVVLTLGLLAALAVRFGNLAGAPRSRIQAAAPQLCRERWRGSSVLFIENGDFSASIACGSPHDRVVAGHIEVAYP
jgi:hypothetical protein